MYVLNGFYVFFFLIFKNWAESLSFKLTREPRQDINKTHTGFPDPSIQTNMELKIEF